MPRKSAAALSVAPAPVSRPARPKPHDSLTDAERAVWERVVSSVPAGYITPAQDGILADMCRHEVRAADLADAINRFSLNPADYDSVKALDKLTAMAAREGAAALSCARSLRLTNQSRIHPETAGRADHKRTPDIDWSKP